MNNDLLGIMRGFITGADYVRNDEQKRKSITPTERKRRKNRAKMAQASKRRNRR